MADGDEAGLITSAVAGRLLMLAPEEFRRLDRAGWFANVSKDRYRVVDVVQGHIRYLENERRDTGRTVAEAAKHIDMGQRRFFELLDHGVITRKGKEGYGLDEVRLAYIQHLRKVAAGRGGDSDIDLSSERALLARQQTESVALRNAIARGEYASIEEIALQVETEYSIVRERLLTIPGKLSDGLAMRSREEIEAGLLEELSEALNELNDPTRIAQRAGGAGGAPAPVSEGAQAAAPSQAG
jgi:phage terminase Nu1 subunit (DNA packaging protein)